MIIAMLAYKLVSLKVKIYLIYFISTYELKALTNNEFRVYGFRTLKENFDF